MKQRTMFSLLFLFFFCKTADGTLVKAPSSDAPGLLTFDKTIELVQADFDSGSYRITQPGYYYLGENIVFSPIENLETARTDKPIQGGGWFTAVSIECDNVVLDLNKKTISMSQEFAEKQVSKVFSLIELGNSPFPHLIFAYNGVTELSFANNVIIKNGVLGLSTHHGIHGNRNASVSLYDLTIRDWEVAGIALNGLQSGIIKNISISGIEHPLSFTGKLTNMIVALRQLELLKEDGDRGTDQFMQELQTLIDDPTQNGSGHPTNLHDGPCYGILLNRTFHIGPIATYCDLATSNCISIENVDICNIKTAPIESVGIGYKNGSPIKGEVFGMLLWESAYKNGIFKPNALLRAQAYAVKQRDAKRPTNKKEFPAGLADAILTGNEEAFLALIQPVFNVDSSTHTTKGVFGIRADCGHGIRIKNCTIMGIENRGNPGLSRADIPAGDRYNDTILGRYTGNDVYGISLAACHNCEVIDCTITECRTKHGNVYGVALMNGSVANTVINTRVSDLLGVRDDVDSFINPSSKAIGFYINNQSNANTCTNCHSVHNRSARMSIGFFAHTSANTLFENCTASSNDAYSKEQLTQEKLAVGFSSTATLATTWKNCSAYGMSCSQESATLEPSASIAAGFLVRNQESFFDELCYIVDCYAACNNGGAGTGVGVLLDGSKNGTISGTTLRHNYGTSSVSLGYGIAGTDNPSTNLIVNNKAFKNKTANYKTSPSAPTNTINYTANNGKPWLNDSLQ